MNQQTYTLLYATIPLRKLNEGIKHRILILTNFINYNPTGKNYTNITKHV
jgi:hypothetical protein